MVRHGRDRVGALQQWVLRVPGKAGGCEKQVAACATIVEALRCAADRARDTAVLNTTSGIHCQMCTMPLGCDLTWGHGRGEREIEKRECGRAPETGARDRRSRNGRIIKHRQTRDNRANAPTVGQRRAVHTGRGTTAREGESEECRLIVRVNSKMGHRPDCFSEATRQSVTIQNIKRAEMSIAISTVPAAALIASVKAAATLYNGHSRRESAITGAAPCCALARALTAALSGCRGAAAVPAFSGHCRDRAAT